MQDEESNKPVWDDDFWRKAAHGEVTAENPDSSFVSEAPAVAADDEVRAVVDENIPPVAEEEPVQPQFTSCQEETVKSQVAPYAIIAFVLAACTCSCSCVTGIPALVLAILSFKQINESHGRYTGRGFSWASIVLVVLGSIFQSIYLLANLFSLSDEANSEASQQLIEELLKIFGM